MLTELHIENVAVIERADIEFTSGFNALTGETGAGKSIVIDSLGAVLGERTSRSLVRTGAERATVTAVFSAEGLDDWFEENDIDAEDEVIIRRRINADGKSSAKVNGTAISIGQLRALSARLLDIHGQNDGRQLMDETRHRAYLDGFAGLTAELAEYSEAYRAYKQIAADIEALSMNEEEKRRLEESLRYRVEELSAAELKPGEEETLSTRRDLLRNSEKLTEALNAAYAALYGGDGSAAERLGDSEAFTQKAAAYAPELEETAKQIAEARFSVEDAAERLRDLLDSLDFSPQEYDALETRLAALKRLEKKYSADEAGLIDLLESGRRKLEDIEYSGERLQKLEADLLEARQKVLDAGGRLSKRRREAGDELQQRIQTGLRELNMPSVRFKAEILPKSGDPGFDSTGMDEVKFLMSANAGEKPGRISRIASGGELARIMLVMKDVLSERGGVGTMVFDEIDEGISGVAAQRVAEKMARLSRKKQVICVTHLPQISAMADGHYKIEKTERDGRTYTAVTRLDENGRVRELARLHGGDNITETTLKSAAEQLSGAEEYKINLK